MLSERVCLEIGAAVQALGWQPIETAPKDGSTVMVFCTGDVWEWRLMSWNDEDQEWQSSLPDAAPWKGPTHWMPLPPAPTLVSELGGEG